jgi:hypothetical protein
MSTSPAAVLNAAAREIRPFAGLLMAIGISRLIWNVFFNTLETLTVPYRGRARHEGKDI